MSVDLGPRSESLVKVLLQPCAQQALRLLLEGYDYAHDLQESIWDFAVTIRSLLDSGCSMNTLRWLVRRGFAEHGPATGAETAARRHATEGLEFPQRTSFILTDRGASAARVACSSPAASHPAIAAGEVRDRAGCEIPCWDDRLGVLRYLGQLVKRFRKAASNQRTVLDAFQRQGWSELIEDPLPRPEYREVNVKQRLHDTVKNLNRDHEALLLHFHGADSGRGVGWKALI